LFGAAVIIIVFGFWVVRMARDKSGTSNTESGVKVTSLSGISNKAKDLEAKGNLYEAKLFYQKLVNDYPNSSEVANWQKKAEELNIRVLFSPVLTPKSILYEIKPGDTLTKIANEYKTTVDLIKKSNNISDDTIMPGRKIKIWNAPFSIFVDKSQNTLILKSDDEIIKTYTVATGANNCTPVGTFKIINKLTNPTWFKAGAVVAADSPENILGSRWLGINVPGYGIHGTTEPQSLGRQVTQGCVRMANPDVEELYTIVPIDTEVTIVD
jgi:lipoprotein-anchoring transpeptidase ErfK/SrfK